MPNTGFKTAVFERYKTITRQACSNRHRHTLHKLNYVFDEKKTKPLDNLEKLSLSMSIQKSTNQISWEPQDTKHADTKFKLTHLPQNAFTTYGCRSDLDTLLAMISLNIRATNSEQEIFPPGTI